MAINRTRKNFVNVVASPSTTIANRCTLGMACAQAVAMRGAPTAARRLVAALRNQQPYRSDPHECDRHFIQLRDVR